MISSLCFSEDSDVHNPVKPDLIRRCDSVFLDPCGLPGGQSGLWIPYGIFSSMGPKWEDYVGQIFGALYVHALKTGKTGSLSFRNSMTH